VIYRYDFGIKFVVFREEDMELGFEIFLKFIDLVLDALYACGITFLDF
jgi:hypothetical protein